MPVSEAPEGDDAGGASSARSARRACSIAPSATRPSSSAPWARSWTGRCRRSTSGPASTRPLRCSTAGGATRAHRHARRSAGRRDHQAGSSRVPRPPPRREGHGSAWSIGHDQRPDRDRDPRVHRHRGLDAAAPGARRIATRSVLADHHRLLGDAFREQDGVEQGTAGDGLYFTFPTARGALLAAIAGPARAWPAMPGRDGRGPRPDGHPHRRADGRARPGYVGLDVHRAARIGASAMAARSSSRRRRTTSSPASSPADVGFVDLGEHQLKDLPRPSTSTRSWPTVWRRRFRRPAHHRRRARQPAAPADDVRRTRAGAGQRPRRLLRRARRADPDRAGRRRQDAPRRPLATRAGRWLRRRRLARRARRR